MFFECPRKTDDIIHEAMTKLPNVAGEDVRHETLIRRSRIPHSVRHADKLEKPEKTSKCRLVPVFFGHPYLPVPLLAVQTTKNLGFPIASNISVRANGTG